MGFFRTHAVSSGPLQGAEHRLPDKENTYDVIIIGAGPCGAAAAYFLSTYATSLYAGSGLRVALLDKAHFPRDKYCGDAWCKRLLNISPYLSL